MAKFDRLPKPVNRVRRIIGRVISFKHLRTQFVYRFDDRPPAEIARSGFQPRFQPRNKDDAKVNGVSKIEHVNNAYAPDHPKAGQPGQQPKDHSQFVSTGGYGMLKNIDPTFAQKLLRTNIYKIDTKKALETGLFFDANDHFDKKGKDRPYPTQREWIKEGGIDPKAVIAFMDGETFWKQCDQDKLVGPDEKQLEKLWKP